MQNLRRLLFVLVMISAASRAQPSLENARRAQLVLGPEVWSRIIRVENASRNGRYPRVVYALVFELERLLWFYADLEGTQSFSLQRDRIDEEKADFGPLLRDIEPGFGRWRDVGPEELPRAVEGEPLRNGCFIESVALWRERVARGEPIAEPRLLSYYFDPRSRQNGHTVLAFRDGDAIKVIDPVQPGQVIPLARAEAADALSLAREHGGRAVRKARFLPLGPTTTAAVPAGAVG